MTMLITIMFVILMVVIAAMYIYLTLILLEIISAASFITLKCAIMTKGIVVTTLELLMESVMTETIIDSVNLMEETAALD